MSKIHFVCSRPECINEGDRYESQIRNPDRLYCSYKCKSLDEPRFVTAENNPNFRHGRYVHPTCDCGSVKDNRSEQCAECARTGFPRGKKRTQEEILSIGESRDGYIRKYVMKNKLIEYVCECGQGPIWMGKTLTLHLDHINGNPADNRLENLRFLCPNCHDTTETFGNKNKLRKKGETDD